MTQPYPLPRETRSTGIVDFDGVSQIFGPSAFKIFDIEDVQVLIRREGETFWTGVTDTVTIAKTSSATYDTFTVDFGTVHPATSQYIVQGSRTPERSVAITKGGGINSNELEAELSKLAIEVQELKRELSARVRVPAGELAPSMQRLGENRIYKTDAGGNLIDGGSYDEIEAAKGYAEAAAAYATYVFPTKEEAEKVPLSPKAKGIHLQGWYAPGDAGKGELVRVDSEPSHPGKVRMKDRYLSDGVTISEANGGWLEVKGVWASWAQFGIKADGTDETAAIQAVINAGYKLQGFGLTALGISGGITLPQKTTIWHSHFKQLSPGASIDFASISSEFADDLSLMRVSLDKGNDASNGGLINPASANGPIDDVLGMYFKGGSRHSFVDLKVTGNGAGTAIKLESLDNTSTLLRPAVAGILFVRTDPTGSIDEHVIAISVKACNGLIVRDWLVSDLTSQVINPHDGQIDILEDDTLLFVISGNFTAENIGDPIRIDGAGVAAANLETTISDVIDRQHIRITTPASTSVTGALVTFACNPCTRHTIGVLLDQTVDCEVTGGQAYRLDQAVAGARENGNLRPKITHNLLVDCYSNGAKFSGPVKAGIIFGNTIVRPGMNGILASGPNKPDLAYDCSNIMIFGNQIFDPGKNGEYAARDDIAGIHVVKGDDNDLEPYGVQVFDNYIEANNTCHYAVYNEGVKPTVGALNEQVRNRIVGSYLIAPESGWPKPWVAVRRDTTQNILSDQSVPYTPVYWDAEGDDSCLVFDPAGGTPYNVKATKTGWHEARVRIKWPFNATGERMMLLARGGALINPADPRLFDRVDAEDTKFPQRWTSDKFYCYAGDDISLHLWQNSGVTLAIQPGSTFTLTFLHE